MQLPDLDYEPTIPAALHRAAREFGDDDYLVMADLRMSFAEVEAASRRFARRLLAAGVGKGTRVGIQFSYGPEWLVTFMAITRIGAVCLPLSTAYVPAELAKTVRHGDVSLLLVPETLFGRDHVDFVEQAFPGVGGSRELFLEDAPFLRSIWITGDAERSWATTVDLERGGETIPEEFLAAVESEVTPGDWLMIIHTSGTTGEPKGVVHTHGAFVRHCDNLSTFAGMDRDFVQFSGLPWFWIGGVVLSVGQALAKGFRLVCMETYDEATALDLVIAEQVDQIGMWPQLLRRFLLFTAASGRDTSAVPALAPPPPGVPLDPDLRHNSLGQTETLGPHTAAGPEAERILPEEMRGSFGLKVPYVEHRIVRPETGEELPDGEEGEVCIRGYSVMAGLYKHEKQDAFDDDGWVHTGDRGYFVDGYLYFTGRFTEMIKTSGANVSPREVELVLEESPEVGLAVVIGLPDPERDQIVAAVLIPAPGAEIDLDEVRASAGQLLSRYKVPRHFLVVAAEDMPQLGSGKPDKRVLSEMLAADFAAAGN